jgi:hypothetical protein
VRQGVLIPGVDEFLDMTSLVVREAESPAKLFRGMIKVNGEESRKAGASDFPVDHSGGAQERVGVGCRKRDLAIVAIENLQSTVDIPGSGNVALEKRCLSDVVKLVQNVDRVLDSPLGDIPDSWIEEDDVDFVTTGLDGR